MSAPALDEAASALAADDSAPLVAALAALGMAAPDILWNPREADLPDPRLCRLLVYWNGLRARKSAPRLSDVDPVAIGDAVGYAMLSRRCRRAISATGSTAPESPNVPAST